MATKVNVNGKLVTRPGVYTLIKSATQNNPVRLDYGVVAIVDDGIGASWGGGKGKESYSFDTIQDFKNFVKGGQLYDLAEPLWRPVKLKNLQGVSKIILIQARDTTPAVISYAFTNGDVGLTSKDEGLNANGVEVSSELKQGYASTFEEVNPRTGPAAFDTTITVNPDTGVAQVNRVTASNIKIGDLYTITVLTTDISITASSASILALNQAFKAAIEANSTLNALWTVVATSTYLELTATATNTPFTQSSSVVEVGETFIMKIWHGSYKGIDSLNNTPFDGVLEANAKPILLAQSPSVKDLTELQTWLNTDSAIQAGFIPVVTIDSGLGDFISADASGNTGNNLAVGGTEDYNQSAWDEAINKAKEANCSFFFAMKYGADVTDDHNDAILSDVILPGKYERFLWIGGGTTALELESVSIVAADHYDSDKVVVVHGDGLNTAKRNSFKKRSVLWKTADVLGRVAGLEPQTPLTLKSTGLDAEANPLDETQQERALSKGVLVTYTDEELGYNVVLQGINSLQTNEDLVNEDGSSFSIAVKRITAQLNKEIAIFLKRKFFGKDTVGPNRNTVTESDLVAAVEGYLQKRTASTLQDDLIIKFQNVTAAVDQDTYRVNYEFVPNFEINKFIVTGIILDK